MRPSRRTFVNLFTALVAGGALLAAAPAAQAAILIHGQDTAAQMLCIHRAWATGQCAEGAAQTFTVEESGDLWGLDLGMTRKSTTTQDLVVELHADSPSGALLGTSDPLAASEIPVGPVDGALTPKAEWVPIDFSTPVEVSKGDVVAIVIPIDPLDFADWGWAMATNNPYDGGRAWGYLRDRGSWKGSSNGSDMTFVTYVQAGPSMFVDTVDSKFFWDIEWMYDQGITSGCDDYEYCPNKKVTRGQMAAFLDRALDLPDSTTDYFTDDNGSKFEASINALAGAGITSGCSAAKYCPNKKVTRGQMAAFLHRALDPTDPGGPLGLGHTTAGRTGQSLLSEGTRTRLAVH